MISLVVLVCLRDALRSGDIHVPGSRRYANPTTYLIARDAWLVQREELGCCTAFLDCFTYATKIIVATESEFRTCSTRSSTTSPNCRSPSTPPTPTARA